MRHRFKLGDTVTVKKVAVTIGDTLLPKGFTGVIIEVGPRNTKYNIRVAEMKGEEFGSIYWTNSAFFTHTTTK